MLTINIRYGDSCSLITSALIIANDRFPEHVFKNIKINRFELAFVKYDGT